MRKNDEFLEGVLSVKAVNYPKKVKTIMDKRKLIEFVEKYDLEKPLQVKLYLKALNKIYLGEGELSYEETRIVDDGSIILDNFYKERNKHLKDKMKELNYKFNKKLLKEYLPAWKD